MKRGFTLIELMTVAAIIAVLLTIVISASKGAIKESRTNRAQAMGHALEQGLFAYYAQEGKWPDVIESKGVDSDDDTVSFTPSENDSILQEIVGKGIGKSSGARSMLVDATALFVAKSSKLKNSGRGCNDNHSNSYNDDYCGDKGCIAGCDFMTAANRNSKHYINFTDMAFGYAGPKNGKFCRFWVTYLPKTDSISISKPSTSGDEND